MNLLPFLGTAFGGQIVHILFKLAKLEKRKEFKFATWIQKNTFTTLAAFTSAAVGIWFLQETLINGNPQLAHGVALGAGYALDSAIKNGKKTAEKYK